jgi:MEDS: MEthanogen/methylotroph, DcmR Sensory domain/Putative zinc-finger
VFWLAIGDKSEYDRLPKPAGQEDCRLSKRSKIPAAVNCEEVWPEISNYLDGAVAPALRQRIAHHARTCSRCKSVLDGTRNVVALMGSEAAFELPPHVAHRLYSKLDQHLEREQRGRPETIPSGITGEEVALGSHLIYFWESQQDFEQGVRFLYPGLGQGDHCIAFGHDEALENVQQTLRANGYDPDRLIAERQLTILPRRHSADATVSDIAAVMLGALRAGAKAIRFLGNLGMGRDPLPAGEDDVLELETRVTSLLGQVPGVVVCMYDVRTLSGRMILKGGLQTHHLTVCPEGIRQNPYYVPGGDPLHVH